MDLALLFCSPGWRYMGNVANQLPSSLRGVMLVISKWTRPKLTL